MSNLASLNGDETRKYGENKAQISSILLFEHFESYRFHLGKRNWSLLSKPYARHYNPLLNTNRA